MTNQNTNLSNILNLHNQQLTLDRLSLVNANKTDMADWVSNLSMLNLGETARQFFLTLKELAILKVDDQLRLELIEIMRPGIYTIISSLSRHYYNKNLNIEARSDRIAVLVQEMRLYLFNIYYDAAERLIQDLSTRVFGLFAAKQKKILQQNISLSLHRSLTELAGLLYELQMLYRTIPEGFWQHSHRIYSLAIQHDLQHTVIEDKTNTFVKGFDLSQAYARLVIMGAINSNKLRQTEIRAIYSCTEFWSTGIHIDSAESPYATHAVNLDKDHPPVYITKNKDEIRQGFFINSQRLLHHFKNLVSESPTFLHPLEPKQLGNALKIHLITNFSSALERAHQRHPYHGEVEISFGIISAHYHLSNGKSFEEVIHIQRDFDLPKEFLSMSHFGQVSMEMGFEQPAQNQPKMPESLLEQCEIYSCQVVNISPGGYCIRWQCDIPNTLRTGELIILREPTDKVWHIGLIRWVNQTINKNIEFGIEIISSQAKPCGVRASHKNDEIESFKRALLLPETQSLNRPATLLTPAFCFHSHQPVYIRHGSEEIKASLNSQYLITQSFIQFQYIVEEQEYSSTTLAKKHTIHYAASPEEDEIWKIL